MLNELRRYDEALPELARACELDNQNADSWYRLGIAHRELQHAADAATALQKAAALSPTDPDILFLLGQSLQTAGDQTQAVAVWKRVIALNPNHPQALYALMRVSMKENPEQARKYRAQLSTVREETGLTERARALSNLAIASAAAGKWKDAIGQLQEAIEVCKSCFSLPLLRKNLGLTQCRAGQFDDGEKQLRLALKDIPGDPEITQALSTLAGLRAQRK